MRADVGIDGWPEALSSSRALILVTDNMFFLHEGKNVYKSVVSSVNGSSQTKDGPSILRDCGSTSLAAAWTLILLAIILSDVE